MTNDQLSEYFSEIYNDIKIYTNKAKYSLNSQHIDTSAILAECYLHLNRYLPQITTREHVESYSKAWIKQNLTWQSSPIKRLYRTKFTEILVDVELAKDGTDFSQIGPIIDEFTNTLTTYERRLWSIYYEKDKTSGRLIAEHLGMSKSTGYQILRQCKQISERFKKYLKSRVI